jgi:hypothetical protein
MQQLILKSEAEFAGLEKRESEMHQKTEKTRREFLNLKAETYDDSSKTISSKTYKDISDQVKQILNKFQKKENKTVDPITMLLEIETRIEYAGAWIAHNSAEGGNYNREVAAVKDLIKKEKKEKEQNLMREKLEAETKARDKKSKERIIVTGVKRMMPVSIKSTVEKKKEKKIELTQDQMDMKKYGGDALFQSFKNLNKVA